MFGLDSSMKTEDLKHRWLSDADSPTDYEPPLRSQHLKHLSEIKEEWASTSDAPEVIVRRNSHFGYSIKSTYLHINDNFIQKEQSLVELQSIHFLPYEVKLLSIIQYFMDATPEIIDRHVSLLSERGELSEPKSYSLDVSVLSTIASELERAKRPNGVPDGQFYKTHKMNGESAPEFIERVYGRAGWLTGEFTRADLRRLDLKAEVALRNWEFKNGRADLLLPTVSERNDKWLASSSEGERPEQKLARSRLLSKRKYNRKFKN